MNVELLDALQAVAGTLHNVLYGKLDVEFDESLLKNDELLDRVAAANAATNGRKGRRGKTYLLSQVFAEDSCTILHLRPSHHATDESGYRRGG